MTGQWQGMQRRQVVVGELRSRRLIQQMNETRFYGSHLDDVVVVCCYCW